MLGTSEINLDQAGILHRGLADLLNDIDVIYVEIFETEHIETTTLLRDVVILFGLIPNALGNQSAGYKLEWGPRGPTSYC
jgi:hypothetical protein